MKTMHKEVLHKVRPKLMDLEHKRREMQVKHKVQSRKIMWIVTATILAVLCVFIIMSWSFKALLFISFIIFGIGVYQIHEHKSPSTDQLHKMVGNTVMELLQPDWEYKANAHIPQSQFAYLGLTQNFDTIEGSHLTKGRHGETNFSFSFVRLVNKASDNDASIFKGLILIADFHKNTKSKTLIFPDIAQQLMGDWFGKKAQEKGWKGLDLVYLEDPAFEKQFVVYSADQVEARYILTPSMMERLVNLGQKYKNRLSFAFTNGKVCVTVDGLLPAEVNVDTTINPNGTFHRFSKPIDLVTEIIDVMELNTRIWEKN